MRLKGTEPTTERNVLRWCQMLIAKDKHPMFGERLFNHLKVSGGTGTERSIPFTTAPTAGATFWIEIDICAPPSLTKNVDVM